MTLVWTASLLRRDVSIVDIFWGPGFALAAWVYFLATDAPTTRRFLVPALVTVWGLRLALHILKRSIGKGEDYRYAQMRAKNPRVFPWMSLATVFLLQALILWVVSFPLLQAQRSHTPAALTWLDWLGLALFLAGLLFETVGDWQLTRFKADPENKGRVMDRGLWRYTRHPNYFGDALLWWGLTLPALATPSSWWVLVSPALMTLLLLKVSGVALLEKNLTQRRPGYRDYMERTSSFFPLPPRKSPR
jgi:steroid 5-alpha reductase family enzyme